MLIIQQALLMTFLPTDFVFYLLWLYLNILANPNLSIPCPVNGRNKFEPFYVKLHYVLKTLVHEFFQRITSKRFWFFQLVQYLLDMEPEYRVLMSDFVD